MSDLKTVIYDALDNVTYAAFNEGYRVGQGGHSDGSDELESYAFLNQREATELATAIRDHFLDREKVRAVLIAAYSEHLGLPGSITEEIHDVEPMVDRLIAGLSGGSE